VNYVPRIVLLVAGVLLDIVGGLVKRNLPLTSYRVRSIKELSFDCSAARRDLGWGPTSVSRALRQVQLHDRVHHGDAPGFAGEHETS
jgi:hypothetical protein